MYQSQDIIVHGKSLIKFYTRKVKDLMTKVICIKNLSKRKTSILRKNDIAIIHFLRASYYGTSKRISINTIVEGL